LFEQTERTPPVANITLTRRHNTLALFQAYAEQQVVAGAAPKGIEQAFAATLQISPSMWSQIKSSRPIGDKLARQIDSLSRKPVGWLDEPHTAAPPKAAAPTAAELAFMALALAAFRATTNSGRKVLRERLTQVVSASA
jgi:hypothetical protein